MNATAWQRVPLTLQTDLVHGGRWTSLRTPDREWLWSNPDPDIGTARTVLRSGAVFVDAGGVEECLPTVRGRPDHGDAWSRPWSGTADDACAQLPGLGVLERRISSDGELRVDYRLKAEPGTRFLHAVHALLDVSPDARLVVPGVEAMTVLDSLEPQRAWPSGLDRLGPDDGSAICALLPGSREATVTDGDHALNLHWDLPGRSELCSLLLWRNLRGWPAAGPYRSIGIEPMIGRAADLSTAGAGDCVRVDDSGQVDWTLSLAASIRRPIVTEPAEPAETAEPERILTR